MINREPESQKQRERESRREIQLESQRDYLWLSLSLAHSLSLTLSGPLWLSLAFSDSLWLSMAFSLSGSLTKSLRLSLTLSDSLSLRICLQSPCLAHKALARLGTSFLSSSTLFWSACKFGHQMALLASNLAIRWRHLYHLHRHIALDCNSTIVHVDCSLS